MDKTNKPTQNKALPRSVGMVSKLQYNANLNICRINDYSSLNDMYWIKQTLDTFNTIQTLQKCTLQKISLKKHRDPFIKLLVYGTIRTKEKPVVSLKYSGDNHSYQIKAVTIKLLGTPLFKRKNCRTCSAKEM